MKYNSNVTADPSARQIGYFKRHQGHAVFLPFEVEINELDIDALQKSISFFVQRHDSVRTTFPLIDGQIKQMLLSADDERFALEFIDTTISGQPYEEIRDGYFKDVETMLLDKAKQPLIKFFLFKLKDGRHKFIFLIDQVISDRWSMEKIVKKELVMFYQCYLNGTEPDIAPLKVNLIDYCNQRKKWLHDNREELGNFWKAKTFNCNTAFNIGDFYNGYFFRNDERLPERINTQKTLSQEELFAIYDAPDALVYTIKISGQRFAKIKELVKINNCSTSTIIYASLYMLLYCYADKNKALLKGLIADRFTSETKLIVGNLIGEAYFSAGISDNLVLSEIIQETFFEILTNCQNMIIDHDYLDLDGPTFRACCDISVNYIQFIGSAPELSEIIGKHVVTEGIFYPIFKVIHEFDDGFVLYWKYNKHLFHEELIEDMVKCYNGILDFVAENDDRTIKDLKNHLKQKTTPAVLV